MNKAIAVWFFIGAMGSLAYIQDVRRACAIEPQGWRVLAAAALGPLAVIIALPGATARCEAFALATPEKQPEAK